MHALFCCVSLFIFHEVFVLTTVKTGFGLFSAISGWDPFFQGAQTLQGLHLTADLYRCKGDFSFFADEQALATLCRTQTERSGWSIVCGKGLSFSKYNA